MAEGVRDARERSLAALFVVAVIVVTAHAGAAYLPSTWGWVSLGPLVASGAAVVALGYVEGTRFDLAFLGSLLLLCLWTWLSVLWSDSIPRSVAEVERDLVYAAAITALLVFARERSLESLNLGLLAAVTAVCGYGLLTRLFPDAFGLDTGAGYRLFRPIGYWNALGITAAMGMLLALDCSISARKVLIRALACGALVVLVCTLYFTYSRTAWIALFAGAVAVFSFEPNRVRLAVVTAWLVPVLALAVWLSSRFRWLNDADATLRTAAHEGHRLAFILACLVVLAVGLRLALERLPRRRWLPRAVWTGAAVALATAGVAVIVVGLVRIGGPTALWSRASDSFRASPFSPNSNLDSRLFSLSGHSRVDYWRVAWSETAAHPWLGSGAGTYDLYWARLRALPVTTLDAHSLYLETLAELGPIGLFLLVTFLVTPLLALRRARGQPLVAGAFGAYVAYLLAAGVDWYWEIPTVTLVGLFCATTIVVAARGSSSKRTLTIPQRGVALALLAAASVAAVVVQVGNSAIADGAHAAGEGRYAQAAADDARGTRWAPWSALAWQSLGRAQRAMGDVARARASFRKAIEKDPRDWEPWYDFAVASRGEARAHALATIRRLNPLAPLPPSGG
jgi:O-Antigen ligase